MKLKKNFSVILNIILVLSLIVLTLFSIQQNKLQNTYKDYLSHNLSMDLITLAQAIKSNNKIYEQLLQNDAFERNIRLELEVLYDNYRSMASITGTYSSMYNQLQQFNATTSIDTKHFSSSTVIMRNYLQEIITKNSFDNTKIRKVLEKEYALNSEWLRVINHTALFSIKKDGEIYYTNDGEVKIQDSNWVDFFKDLESTTRDNQI